MGNLREKIVNFRVNLFRNRKNKSRENEGSHKRIMNMSTLFLIIAYLCIVFIISLLTGRSLLEAVSNRHFNPVIIMCCSSLLLLTVNLIIVISKGKDFIAALIIQIIEICGICIAISTFDNGNILSCSFIVASGLILSFVLKIHYNSLRKELLYREEGSHIDVLTGCLNKRGLDEIIKLKEAEEKSFYLLLIDIDNFRALNDTLGHEAGDDLLRLVAKKWTNIQASDKYTLAHLAEDEFAMIIETKSQLLVEAVAEEVLKSIRVDNEVSSYVTASIGIVAYPFDTRDIKKLQLYATTALGKAKEAGKNQCMFFDEAMYKEMINTYKIEKDVNRALKSNSFVLAYQPQYTAKDHKLYGFEVLLRMKTENGLVFPKNFIDIAEKSGQIHSVDSWVIKNALEEAKEIIKMDPSLRIAINVSSEHIAEDDMIEDTVAALNNSGISPSQFSIEVTESAYVRHIDAAIGNLKKIKMIGCNISIDDFGMGHSSLSYLAKAPVDTIKVSKAFMDTVDFVEDSKTFINVIANLGHSLNCKVIVEGVERTSQLKAIRDLDIDIIQGYLWGKPLEIQEALSIIHKSK